VRISTSKSGSTFNKNKRTTSQHKSTLKGLNPDTAAGWKVLRADASALKTVRDVDEMQKEIESLPGSITPGRKSLLAILTKQRASLTAQQLAQPQPAQQQAVQPAPAQEQAAAQADEAELERGQRTALLHKQTTRQQHLDAALKLRRAAAEVRQLETAPQRNAAALEAARRQLALMKDQEQEQYQLLARAELKLADLQMRQAEADLRQLEAAPHQVEAKLEAARAQVQERTTELKKWQLEEAWVQEGQKVPSWDELPGYAAKIPRRRNDEQPHSMLTHLLQRLSDARNGDGPPVKVRAARPDGAIRYETVTKANYQDVVKAAGAFRWEGFDVRNLRAIEKLTTDWQPLPVSQDDVDNMVSEWRKKLQTTGFPEDKDGNRGPDLATAYQTQLATACRKILEWVEPGVRDLVGLPDIVVHGPDDPKFKPEDEGEYNAKNKAIHLVSAKLRSGEGAELLLHEFGHHIEDQGPAETWGSFASFLGRLGRGANLMPQREYWDGQLSNNPLYCWPDTGSRPKLPRAHDGYSLQYYLTGLTESIPLALENSVPDDPGGATDNNGDNYDSEYIGLVLPAIRPEAARKAGMDLWTWL
jgi:hypothetical protein